MQIVDINLVMMNHKDHLNYHRNIQNVIYTDNILENVAHAAKSLMTMKETIDYVNINADIENWKLVNSDRHPKNRDVNSLKFTYKDLARISCNYGYKDWRSYRKTFDYRLRNDSGRILKKATAKKYSNEWRQLLSESAKNRIAVPCQSWKVIDQHGNIEIVENLSKFCRDHKLNLNRSNIKGKFGSHGYHAEKLRNHKAISVEWLNEKIDVGCITVDLEETYHSHHTYLLDAGVYTKNTMLEDYWLPRREGGRGTEVTTLPGGQTLGEMDDVLYFQKKLYQTLNVPVNRLNSDALFSLGRATEVTRDEVKFAKFVQRLRNKFSRIFDDALKIQLALKGICSKEEWDEFKEDIYYDYKKDNNFTEMREAELLKERMAVLQIVDPYIGKYYSLNWVRKNILQFNDEQIEEMDKEMKDEEDKGIGGPTVPPDAQGQGQEQPEVSPEQYPPEDNTQEAGSTESLTPMLDREVEKYSSGLNKR